MGMFWGYVLGIYISPRWRIAEVERRLDRVKRMVQPYLSSPVIISGDFNAHSALWTLHLGL